MRFLGNSLVIVLSAATAINAFQHNHVTPSCNNQSRSYTAIKTCLYSDTKGKNGKTKFGQRTDAEVSRFLTEFRTADGNVVDPYKLLRVSRSATTIEIKQSYRKLSRKLHPDAVAQTNILPGTCTNLDEVREEWERVKFSYEILSDPKVRKNYDRNSSVATVLEDPGAAVGRAVLGGAMSGMGMLVGGAWKLGEMATKKAYETAMSEKGQPKVVQREDTRDETTSSPSEPVSKTNNASTTGMGSDEDQSIEAKKQASMEILMSFANGNNGPSGTATNGSASENTNERALKEKSKNNQKGITNASTATKSKPAAKSKPATKRVKANTKSKTKTATKEKKTKGSTNAKSKTKTATKKKNKGSTVTSVNANGNTMSMITPDSVYKNTKKRKQTKRKTGGAKGFSKSR